MITLIAYLFLALFVSFLCSIAESTLLSVPPSYLVSLEKKKKPWAKGFLELKANIEKPLSAILSLNTVAHTIGAAGVGAQAVKIFGEAAFGIVSAILTILILIITEIIPKTLGANYWRGLSRISYYIIRGMIWITYPLIILSSVMTKAISGNNKENTISREEISVLANIGKSEGLFSDKENKIIQNILKLKKIKITEIMTPRVVVAKADENLTMKDFLEHKENLKFSRIPIYEKKKENITGYVVRNEVFEHLAEQNFNKKLKHIKRNIIAFPGSLMLYSLWEKMLEEKQHIALIVDEFGGMDGIITLEDIFETLLGLEIVDENDEVTDMQKYAREKWKQKQQKYEYINQLNRS